MSKISKELAVEVVTNAFPYPNHITKWDLSSEDRAIRFTWRQTNRFRFDIDYLSIEEVGDGVLIGSDICILAESLIKKSYYEISTSV